MSDLTHLTAAELSRLYRKGKASPVETMKAVLARTARINSEINALCHVDAEPALKAARDSERRWKKGKPLSPIDGVPVSIKELVRVKGWPASMGSKLTDKAPVDAAPSLKAARAIPGTQAGRRAARRVAPVPRLPQDWGRLPSAPMAAARCAFPRASTASSASRPRSAACRLGRRR